MRPSSSSYCYAHCQYVFAPTANVLYLYLFPFLLLPAATIYSFQFFPILSNMHSFLILQFFPMVVVSPNQMRPSSSCYALLPPTATLFSSIFQFSPIHSLC